MIHEPLRGIIGIAVSLSKNHQVHLVYCFEKDGVLADRDDDSSLIRRIDPELFSQLKANGTVADGMLPKLENAFRAISDGVEKVVIKNSRNITNDLGTELVSGK